MKIRINKIFGKYNNEIDLDNKINIFIGENGIGKSTTIKILGCLFNFDYIGLINYYFESIEIFGNQENIMIKYSDLTINPSFLLKECIGDEFLEYKEVKKQYNDFIMSNSDSANYHPSYLVGKTDEEKKKIDLLLRYYDMDLFINSLDDRLLYKILKFNNKILANEKIIKTFDEGNGLASYCISSIEAIYKNAIKVNDDGIYYTESNVSKIHYKLKNELSFLGYQDVLLIDMSSEFKVTNDLNRKYIINDVEKESMSIRYKEMLDNNKCNSILKRKTWVGRIASKYDGLLKSDVIKKLKDNLKVLKDTGFNKNNNTIDLGHFLFYRIYTDDLIDEFKNDFYDYLYQNINKEEIKNYRLSSQSFNKLRIYLYPLIDKNNIFNEIFNYDINTDTNNYIIREELNLIIPFYQKYKEKYFEINNEKLNKLNILFKKYFKNKEIIATPFGISISTCNYCNDINFEELSMGEKRIIILLTISVFSDDLIVLLDEPETSLSVVWQEQLLPDLIGSSKLNKLIVATQSPYIIESEDLDEYIIPLIDGDANE